MRGSWAIMDELAIADTTASIPTNASTRASVEAKSTVLTVNVEGNEVDSGG